MSALEAAGSSAAPASISNAIRCKYVSRSPSETELLRIRSVLSTSRGAASPPAAKPKMTKDSPKTVCRASRGRTCKVTFGLAASRARR